MAVLNLESEYGNFAEVCQREGSKHIFLSLVLEFLFLYLFILQIFEGLYGWKKYHDWSQFDPQVEMHLIYILVVILII